MSGKLKSESPSTFLSKTKLNSRMNLKEKKIPVHSARKFLPDEPKFTILMEIDLPPHMNCEPLLLTDVPKFN